jgi:hypothetical protein
MGAFRLVLVIWFVVAAAVLAVAAVAASAPAMLAAARASVELVILTVYLLADSHAVEFFVIVCVLAVLAGSGFGAVLLAALAHEQIVTGTFRVTGNVVFESGLCGPETVRRVHDSPDWRRTVRLT